MRKLFISDIHGEYEAMVQLMNAAGYLPNEDQLVVGGDMIDRGPDSGHVLSHIFNLAQMYPDTVHVIGGNHEEMMMWYLQGRNEMWFEHGGYEAAVSMREEKLSNEVVKWATNLPDLYQDEEYVYVHAGVHPYFELDKQPHEEMRWMPYTNRGEHFNEVTAEELMPITGGRKVIYGHTPRKYIFDDGSKICCDLGAGVLQTEAKLALVNLTDDMYWYYDFDTQSVKKRRIARAKSPTIF